MKKTLFWLFAVMSMANVRAHAQSYYSDSIGEVRIDDNFTLVYQHAHRRTLYPYIYIYSKSQLVPMRDVYNVYPESSRSWGGVGLKDGGAERWMPAALMECFLPRQYLNADTTERILITVLYHNTTGEIVGMSFDIPDFPDFNRIPPATYAKLHRYLMSHMQIIPDGRYGRYATATWHLYLNYEKTYHYGKAYDEFYEQSMRPDDDDDDEISWD